MKRRDYIITFLLLTVICLYITRVVFSITTSTNGGELFVIRNRIAEMKRQNNVLKQQILRCESFVMIEQKATLSGFRPATDKDFYIVK